MKVFNVLRAFNKGFVENKLIKTKVYLIGFSYIEQQELINSVKQIQKNKNLTKYVFTNEVSESDLFIINYDHSEKGKSFIKSYLLYVEPNNSIFVSEKQLDKKFSIKWVKNSEQSIPSFDGEQILKSLNMVSVELDKLN